MLADIDRVYAVVSQNDPNSKRRNPNAIGVPRRNVRGEEVPINDDGYDNNNGSGIDANSDATNRGSNIRQSKSANAARSLTRKNQ